MTNNTIPASYRRLLASYPRAWRRDYGDVVLGTLLELHAELGRSRPTLLERLEFLVSGVARRVRFSSVARPVVPSDTLGLAASGFHVFDQSNGNYPDTELDEVRQRRANAQRDGIDAIERVTANAPMGLIVR